MTTGEIRSKIFYCDSMQSSQKPHVENNHNFIREILPNGQDWSHLTQEKLDLMFSHINSSLFFKFSSNRSSSLIIFISSTILSF
jgi:IS30 family transposase